MTKVSTRAGVIIIIIISCGVGPPAQHQSLCLPQLPCTRSPEISGRTAVVESESELTAMQTMYNNKNSLSRNRCRQGLLSVLNPDSFVNVGLYIRKFDLIKYSDQFESVSKTVGHIPIFNIKKKN